MIVERNILTFICTDVLMKAPVQEVNITIKQFYIEKKEYVYTNNPDTHTIVISMKLEARKNAFQQKSVRQKKD